MLKQLEHMKKWALQNQDVLTKKQIRKAFVSMCDDAIAEFEAAQQGVQSDLLPCGHHKDAIVGNGITQWCVACESASR